MTLLFASYTFVFGLLLGSFLNVLIYRLPCGQSVVTPRSYCPQCGRFIPWHDNIPVISFLLLKGHCRACRRKISFRYPLVEGLTALFSLFVYLKFGGGLPYLFYFVLLAAPLIAITFIDLEHKIIPDILSLPGIAAGILATLLLSDLPIIEAALRALIGLLAGGGTLFLVSWFYEKIRHQEGIGGGDIKLAAMLGAFFGWKGIFAVLLFSSLLGSLTGVVLMVVFRKGLKFAIPYGPFLAAGALLYLFYGETLITGYLRLTHHLY
jgi:leader peptidase (prepilin peptidase)/N-methyltransferase